MRRENALRLAGKTPDRRRRFEAGVTVPTNSETGEDLRQELGDMVGICIHNEERREGGAFAPGQARDVG
ncbi:MAG TPA: hypothetical protein VFG50_02635 [Rhodothermales bacterium]|nr:hypothetical protein [Rhodothermales bacterium]